MANYYTGFSFFIPTKNAEPVVAALTDLHEKIEEDAELPAGIFDAEQEVLSLPTFEHDADGIYLYDTQGDIDVTGALVRWLLTFDGMPGSIMFEWAGHTDRPVTDGFGGGAIKATKDAWVATYTGAPEVEALLDAKLAAGQR